jgi:NitT/TauT family transport system substrate-binding protein
VEAPPPGPTAGPLRKLRMAYGFATAEALPMWVALDEGLYTKYGLDVDTVLMQSSAQIAPAMAAGDVDVALTAGAGVVEIGLAGGDQVMIASQTNLMRFFLHARPEIRQVEDLRGQRVAITRLGSGIHLATTIVLERAGFEANRDVTLIQTGASDAPLTALIGGAADAGMMADPTNFFAARQGFPQLVSLTDYRIPFSQGALAVSRSTLDSRYDLVRDFVRGHVEAIGLGKRDPVLAKRLLAKYTQNDDPDLLERSYRVWVEALEELAYPSVAAAQTVLDQRAQENPAARTANPHDFVDDRILRELEASGFLRAALAGPSR